jgi:hypothetical protein
MSHNTVIPCPVCPPGTTIAVEVNSLLKGLQFTCSTCGSVIGIHTESIDAAKHAISKFEDFKKNAKSDK